MKIRIESYSRTTGELVTTMQKSMEEYTEWIMRAARRQYVVDATGRDLFIHGGRGKRYFLVKDVNE